MTCEKVNGLEEADVCRRGEAGACCRASGEVSKLRETLAQQETRIQTLEKQVRLSRASHLHHS